MREMLNLLLVILITIFIIVFFIYFFNLCYDVKAIKKKLYELKSINKNDIE